MKNTRHKCYPIQLLMFCFLALFLVNAFCAPSLSYTIKKLPLNRLQVTLTFIGSKTGKTAILLPNEWGEKKQLYQRIDKLAVSQKNVTLQNTIDPAKKIILHHPEQLVTLQYELKQRFLGKTKKTDEAFEPNIKKDLFFFIGSQGLIIPNLNKDIALKVVFKWHIPNDWKIANSYGMNHKNQITYSTIRELNDALFIAGHIQLKEIKYKNTHFWTATIGTFSTLDLKNYFQICAKLIDFQQNFWNDPNRYHLLAFISLNSNQESFRGAGLYRSFMLALPQNATLQTEFGLSWLAAHELFHAWNRPDLFLITPSHQESSIYWLSEGITDYYAFESLLKTNIYSFEEYIDAYNNVLREYYTSPVRNYTNQEIEQYFWINDDVNKLPYQRGNILAHQWNAKIIQQSHGQYSLDNFIRAIQPTHPKEQYSLNTIEAISKKYLSMGIKKDINRYIDDGELITPDPNSFGSRAKLIFKKEKIHANVFPIKFDPKTHLVTFILKNSQAEKSGLKIGDKIISFDYMNNEATYPVTIIVDDGKLQKTIRYFSEKEKYIQVPQFVVNK